MGMFSECRTILIDALKIAGCKGEPYTAKKRMEVCAESRISGVLCEGETVERTAEKKRYQVDGQGKRRNKIYRREITYTVIIGEYTLENAEGVYENFLINLPAGIYVDGNYVTMEPADAEWMEEKDHILRAKVVVQLSVVCRGGLYKDSDMLRLQDADIEVKKEAD